MSQDAILDTATSSGFSENIHENKCFDAGSLPDNMSDDRDEKPQKKTSDIAGKQYVHYNHLKILISITAVVMIGSLAISTFCLIAILQVKDVLRTLPIGNIPHASLHSARNTDITSLLENVSKASKSDKADLKNYVSDALNSTYRALVDHQQGNIDLIKEQLNQIHEVAIATNSTFDRIEQRPIDDLINLTRTAAEGQHKGFRNLDHNIAIRMEKLLEATQNTKTVIESNIDKMMNTTQEILIKRHENSTQLVQSVIDKMTVMRNFTKLNSQQIRNRINELSNLTETLIKQQGKNVVKILSKSNEDGKHLLTEFYYRISASFNESLESTHAMKKDHDKFERKVVAKMDSIESRASLQSQKIQREIDSLANTTEMLTEEQKLSGNILKSVLNMAKNSSRRDLSFEADMQQRLDQVFNITARMALDQKEFAIHSFENLKSRLVNISRGMIGNAMDYQEIMKTLDNFTQTSAKIRLQEKTVKLLEDVANNITGIAFVSRNDTMNLYDSIKDLERTNQQTVISRRKSMANLTQIIFSQMQEISSGTHQDYGETLGEIFKAVNATSDILLETKESRNKFSDVIFLDISSFADAINRLNEIARNVDNLATQSSISSLREDSVEEIDDLGTKLSTGLCRTSSPIVRLYGSGYNYYGRVEIYHNGVWGTICDDAWDTSDANVICRMLGFERATSAPGSANYGSGSGQIWLDQVECGGSESSIEFCSKNSWGSHDCSHSEDASVVCAHYT